jgi:predicted aminopeptidase
MRVEWPAIMEGTSGAGARMLAQRPGRAADFLKADLDKRTGLSTIDTAPRMGEGMLEEASLAIDRLSSRDRRLREMKYGRRSRMRYIDKLLNELELLNLADEQRLPRALSVAVDKIVEESGPENIEPRNLESVTEAMDVLYELQDSLMFTQIDDE